MTGDPVEAVKNRVTIFDHCEHNEDGLYCAPYRDDTNPSMEIFDNGRGFIDYARQEYKGDIFDFYAAQNELDPRHDFVEILETLASQAGVELNHDEDYEEQRQEQKRLETVMSDICEYYEECLEEYSIDGETILERVKQSRGWTEETIEDHRIGYAPPEEEQDEFIDELIDEYGSDTLLKTGLFFPGGTEPFFTNRIVFPYLKGNRPVYFTARETQTNDDDLGKYVKQMKSKDYVADYIDEPLWTDTSNHSDTVIITEGMPDAITVTQYGYDAITPVTVQFKDDHKADVARATQRYEDAVIINDAEENQAGEEGAQKMLKALDRIRPEHRASLVKKGQLPLEEGQEKNDVEEHLREHDEAEAELQRIIKEANTLFEERFEELPDDEDTVKMTNYSLEILESLRSLKRNARGDKTVLEAPHINRVKDRVHAHKSDVRDMYADQDEDWDDPIQREKERRQEERRERREREREQRKRELAGEGRLVEYEDHLGVEIEVEVGDERNIEYVYQCTECFIQRRTTEENFSDIEMPAMHNEDIPQPQGKCPNCESEADLTHVKAKFTVPEQAYEDVRSEDFLTRIVEEIDEEHVKDHKAKVATLIAFATGWLKEENKRQSVTFKGESSVGKDHVVNTVKDKLPDEYTIDLTGPSTAWLRRNGNRPRVIHVSEVNLQRGGANSANEKIEYIKQTRQGGTDNPMMVKNEDGRWEGQDFGTEQKPFLFGSTEIGQDHEISTREFVVPISYNPEKGKAESKLKAEHHNDLLARTRDEDDHNWVKDAWRLLDPDMKIWNPVHVVVEKYFEKNEDVWAAFQKKHEMPRVMRDKERIKAFSEAVTWIRQYNRETKTVNDETFLIGEPEDFLTAFYVFQDFYTDTYHGLDSRYKEFLDTMEDIEEDYQEEWDEISEYVDDDLITFGEKWIRRSTIAEEMNLTGKRTKQIEQDLEYDHHLVESQYENSWSMIGRLVKRTEGGGKNPRKNPTKSRETEKRFRGVSEGVSDLFQGLQSRLEEELAVWRDRWTSTEAYESNLKKRFFDPLRNQDGFPGEGGTPETKPEKEGGGKNNSSSEDDIENPDLGDLEDPVEETVEDDSKSARERVVEVVDELEHESQAMNKATKENIIDEAEITEDRFEDFVQNGVLDDYNNYYSLNEKYETSQL